MKLTLIKCIWLILRISFMECDECFCLSLNLAVVMILEGLMYKQFVVIKDCNLQHECFIEFIIIIFYNKKYEFKNKLMILLLSLVVAKYSRL